MVTLWTFLGTSQGLLLGGFVLTTLAGGIVAYLFQTLAWKREARLALMQERYKDGTAFLERLSVLVDSRFFALQRYLWAIQEGVPERLASREREYFEQVTKWNESLRSTHNNLRLLVGEREAVEFLDYSDDRTPDRPKSLHYRFVHAHRLVQAAKSDPEAVASARANVERLHWEVSRFVSSITNTFARRAAALTLLQLPSQGAGMEGALLPNRPPD